MLWAGIWAEILSGFKWVRSIWSESDGSGSSTRVHISLILLFTLTSGSVFCYMVAHKSMTIEQFNGFLSTASTFIVTTCGALYGLNKAADYLNNKLPSEGNQNPQQPNQNNPQ